MKKAIGALIGTISLALSASPVRAGGFVPAVEQVDRLPFPAQVRAAAAAERALAKAPREDGCIRIDDMLFEVGRMERTSAFTGESWPDHRVVFAFDDNVTQANRGRWLAAAALWESVCNVAFREAENETAYILVTSSEVKNTSPVGRVNDIRRMFIRDWGQRFTIAHEIGHALGACHEHSRSDRDAYVEILWENIAEGEDHNFEFLFESVNDGSYDFDSLMHYGRDAFSNGGGNTIEPRPAYAGQLEVMGQRSHLSAADMSGMARRYGYPAWSTERITDTSAPSRFPRADCRVSRYVVWAERSAGGGEAILCAGRPEAGESYSAPHTIERQGGASPDVASLGQYVHVVYLKTMPDGDTDIYYRRSRDGGFTWDPAQNLSATAGCSGVSREPSIALCYPYLQVVWAETVGGNDEIYHSRSLSHGWTWSAPQRIVPTPGASRRPRVAFRPGKVCVVWQEIAEGSNADIYLVRSADNGATWRPAQRLSQNAGRSVGADIEFSMQNSLVYAAWQDDTLSPGTWTVMYRRSADNGATWSGIRSLSSPWPQEGWSACQPSLAAFNDKVLVAWSDVTQGRSVINTAFSQDCGDRWLYQRVSDLEQSSVSDPSASAAGVEGFAVFWSGIQAGRWDIFCRSRAVK